MARLRVEKVQEAIQQEISKMLLMDVKDPRIQFVTVTGVELTDDMSYAKIYVSLYGPKDKQEDRKSTRLNSSHHGIGVCRVWV